MRAAGSVGSALVAAALRLIAHPAIASLNLLNQYAALLLLTEGGYLTAFEPAQLQALALFFLEAHGYGYLVAGVFFGLHLLVLGYLLYRSDLFPAVLGVLVVVAAVGYLIESLTFFLLPGYEPIATSIVILTAVVGEVSLALYLLVRGVRGRPATTGRRRGSRRGRPASGSSRPARPEPSSLPGCLPPARLR